MNNEELIRVLIRGSIKRAIQESAPAVFALVAFGAILAYSEVGSPRYYGCLIILVGTGFIAGVVWSYALSYQLLRSHAPSDSGFWREAFHAQSSCYEWCLSGTARRFVRAEYSLPHRLRLPIWCRF